MGQPAESFASIVAPPHEMDTAMCTDLLVQALLQNPDLARMSRAGAVGGTDDEGEGELHVGDLEFLKDEQKREEFQNSIEDLFKDLIDFDDLEGDGEDKSFQSECPSPQRLTRHPGMHPTQSAKPDAPPSAPRRSGSSDQGPRSRDDGTAHLRRLLRVLEKVVSEAEDEELRPKQKHMQTHHSGSDPTGSFVSSPKSVKSDPSRPRTRVGADPSPGGIHSRVSSSKRNDALEASAHRVEPSRRHKSLGDSKSDHKSTKPSRSGNTRQRSQGNIHSGPEPPLGWHSGHRSSPRARADPTHEESRPKARRASLSHGDRASAAPAAPKSPRTPRRHTVLEVSEPPEEAPFTYEFDQDDDAQVLASRSSARRGRGGPSSPSTMSSGGRRGRSRSSSRTRGSSVASSAATATKAVRSERTSLSDNCTDWGERPSSRPRRIVRGASVGAAARSSGPMTMTPGRRGSLTGSLSGALSHVTNLSGAAGAPMGRDGVAHRRPSLGGAAGNRLAQRRSSCGSVSLGSLSSGGGWTVQSAPAAVRPAPRTYSRRNSCGSTQSHGSSGSSSFWAPAPYHPSTATVGPSWAPAFHMSQSSGETGSSCFSMGSYL